MIETANYQNKQGVALARLQRQIKQLITMIALSVVLQMAHTWWLATQGDVEKKQIAALNVLQVGALRMQRVAEGSWVDLLVNAESLNAERKLFHVTLMALKKGDAKKSIIALPLSLQTNVLSRLSQRWQKANDALDTVLANQENLLVFQHQLMQASETVQTLTDYYQALAREQQVLSINASDIPTETLQALLDGVILQLSRMSTSDSQLLETSRALTTQYQRIKEIVQQLKNTARPSAMASRYFSLLHDAEQAVVKLNDIIARIDLIVPQAKDAIYAHHHFSAAISDLDSLTAQLIAQVRQYFADRVLGLLSAWLLSLITVLMIIMLNYKLVRLNAFQTDYEVDITHSDAKTEPKVQPVDISTKNSNQDLQQKQQVLRRHLASTELALKALSQFGHAQGKSIAELSHSTNAIALASRRIMQDANNTSDVVGQTVEFSKKGVIAVNNIVEGIALHQQQILDTASCMKHLSVRIEQVTDTFDLIRDIADKTNILAINAAIQAAMAGEEAKGFVLIADQVQSLSEKVAGAASSMADMMNSMQAESEDAVKSMELSKLKLIDTIELAHDAGLALEAIALVSDKLPDAMLSVSSAVTEQEQATKLSHEEMNALLERAQQMVDKIHESQHTMDEVMKNHHEFDVLFGLDKKD